MEKEISDAETVKTIKPIDKNSVHKICSGQVVLNLATAVKELVENSLDAGATNIEVRLKNYGMDLIEVCDNGSGVVEENFSALTLKYHTSKLQDYSDLLGVKSFGFRGEALSSLSALSDLVITTKHASSNCATKIEYDYKGNIKNKTPCSRTTGTTVMLSNLFFTLPVRQKEFQKNHKREFMKMTQLLYAYCLISTGVKIICTNQNKAGQKTVVVATQGSNSYRDNLACVFGAKQLQSLLEIKPFYKANIKENLMKALNNDSEQINSENIDVDDKEIDLSEDSNEATDSQLSKQSSNNSQSSTNSICPIDFIGFISTCAHGSGRSTTDRQFYYVNSRPCEPTKVIKLVNEIYKQFNPNQYPFVLLNLNLQRDGVDVNVTPDKRQVFLTKEKVVLDVIKSSLVKLFENIPSTIQIEKPDSKIQIPNTSQPRVFTSFLQKYANKSPLKGFNEEKSSSNELKRKSSSILDFVYSKVSKVTEGSDLDVIEKNNINEVIKIDNAFDSKTERISVKTVATINDEQTRKDTNAEINDEHTPQYTIAKINDEQTRNDTIDKETNNESKEVMFLDFTDKVPDTQIISLDTAMTVYCGPKTARKTEMIVDFSRAGKTKTIDDNDKPQIAEIGPHVEEFRPELVKRFTHSVSESKSNDIEISDNSKVLKASTSPQKKSIVTDNDDLGLSKRSNVTMKTSMEHVKALMKISAKSDQKNIDRIKFRTEINPVFNKKCEEELSKEISKESFKRMEVLGQFNLGFIITRLDDDLFIIDQHASDEIYNFETLQKTTDLTSQKLVIAQQLELTGVNEQILTENLEIFKKNGFTFEIDENAPPTKRVKLLTIPMSKSWVFGKDDIEEMLFMLKEDGYQYCRPSRVRAMFASRACRKSVMIGTALGKADMRLLVDHMSEIDKPWNCPHGRPTIRHLVNMAMVKKIKN